MRVLDGGAKASETFVGLQSAFAQRQLRRNTPLQATAEGGSAAMMTAAS